MRSVDIIAFPLKNTHRHQIEEAPRMRTISESRTQLKGPSVPLQKDILNSILRKFKKVKTSNQLSNDRHPMTITANQIGLISIGSTIYDIYTMYAWLGENGRTDKINLINEALIDISELKIN